MGAVQASADFDRGIKINKQMLDECDIDRGLVLSYLGRYEAAIESYRYSLNMKTTNSYISLYNIAIATARWKGAQNASASIDTAYQSLQIAKSTQNQGAALYGLGGLEAILGNFDNALSYLKESLMIEKQAIKWAYDDIAWLDLRNDPRFHALLSKYQMSP